MLRYRSNLTKTSTPFDSGVFRIKGASVAQFYHHDIEVGSDDSLKDLKQHLRHPSFRVDTKDHRSDRSPGTTGVVSRVHVGDRGTFSKRLYLDIGGLSIVT